MPKTKAGYKKIMGEIPIEAYEVIKAYNSVSSKPLNVSRAIEQCLTAEVKKIQAEAAQHVKNEGLICGGINAEDFYDKILKDIDNGVTIPELYKKCYAQAYEIFGKVDTVDYEDNVWTKLVHCTQMTVDRESGKINFLIDDLVFFKLRRSNNSPETIAAQNRTKL